MTDERSTAHTDPAMPAPPAPIDGVPPAPPAPPRSAPPMVAPSTSPGPAMPAPAAQHPGVPPYATALYPTAPYATVPQPMSAAPYGAPPQPTSAPPYGAAPQYPSAAQPYQSAPPPASGSRVAAIVIGSIAGFLLLIALMFVAVFIWLGQLAESSDATSPEDGGGFSATEPETDQTPEAGTDDTAPDDTDTVAAESIAAELEAKIAEYKNARDTGALWNSIPDTEFNRTAVSAFLYLLTDMKVATIWGVDEATAQEFAAEMAHLEELLLSEQPLGSDIEIVLSDRTFRYDGDTGEGGYTDE